MYIIYLGKLQLHDKSVLSTGTLKKFYLDNFCNRDSLKMAQQLTGSVCLIAFFRQAGQFRND